MNAALKAFESFIAGLDAVAWDREDDFDAQAIQVAALLRDVAADPSIVDARARQIAQTPGLLAEYMPHMQYPRPPMDKLVLYMDPGDRFRVRLHRFRADKTNARETIHNHKWHFHSIILKGGYKELQYRIDACDASTSHARVSEAKQTRFERGEANALRCGVPHRIIASAEGGDTFTLFVRGPSFRPFSTRYSDGEGPFERIVGLHDQLKDGLLRAGALAEDPL